ncbi:MAG: hypothetical protein COB02_13685 [Candidatus Cloacimonadota bacterium]|nr:MAG: hypothetical protein COB02_13685 [Candidatus Cloacimonadota bacterium]
MAPILTFQAPTYYNHVLIKYKDYFYELDCGVLGVHQFHESSFPKTWEKTFSFEFETIVHPTIKGLKYSQWANISWFLWNIPIFGILFKKIIKTRFNTNCCGYISYLLQDKNFCYLHPNQFVSPKK